ncbi:Phosphoesterase or phosphohydrolase-like protein [Actibacterium atlanticum]|uniref:Phosphoesterase or phosphohydrolase-like protein n=1 Tax=Actibacterium atlanticum TaxID=1461693 RepID=A0A058ZLC5_9RHOB|nr:metallophosphoesterase [Actibacterium atlanticum]KCV82343.1 Phosphoesterase or phosphohydrolase-like protein [Actibacterium atlanticum]
MVNWYTADTHFGHENIINFCNRPFRDAEHMDRVLIENLRAKVGPEDDLWILGDFAFGKRAKRAPYIAELFNELPGARKHLVIGNHDHGPTLALPWDSIADLAQVRDGPQNQNHTLCHYPMITWNHAGRNALQFFGHVHDNWLGSRNSINVGVDVWDFAPVTYEDIVSRAAKLPMNLHWKDVEPGTME